MLVHPTNSVVGWASSPPGIYKLNAQQFIEQFRCEIPYYF